MPAVSAHLLVLSAATFDDLRANAGMIARALAELPLEGVCAALAHGRPAAEHRLAIVAATPEEAIEQLRGFAAGRRVHEAGVARAIDHGRLGFVFSGQGSAWPGMGARLWARSPAFRDAVLRCHRALGEHGVSVIDELLAPAEGSRLGELAISDPMILTIGYGLVAHWRDLGIIPDGVAGHSGMEVLAAVTAGAISLEHACAVVVARARQTAPLVGRGAMLAIGLPVAEAGALLDDSALGGLAIAAVNARSQTVIAGPRPEIEALEAVLAGRRVFARRVAFELAAHTAALDAMRAPLVAALPPTGPLEPALAMYSPALGRRVHRADLGAEHWFRSVREPARFTDAIAAMIADGFGAFVEIGPHPSLIAGALEVAEHAGVRACTVPSLRREVDDDRAMALAAGIAWAHGLAPRLDRVVPDGPRADLAVACADRAARADGPPPGVVVRSLPGDARAAWLERYLGDQLAALLPGAAQVDLDRPLAALGLDSLRAQAFKHHVELALDLAVPLSVLLGGATGRGLARRLAEALPPPLPDDEIEEGTIDG